RAELPTAFVVRTGEVLRAVRDRARPPLGGAGGLVEGLLPLLPRRPDPHADPLPLRHEGLQRAARRRRADVPGARESRRRDPARALPRPVPRPDPAELSARPLRALPRLVEPLPDAGARRRAVSRRAG